MHQTHVPGAARLNGGGPCPQSVCFTRGLLYQSSMPAGIAYLLAQSSMRAWAAYLLAQSGMTAEAAYLHMERVPSQSLVALAHVFCEGNLGVTYRHQTHNENEVPLVDPCHRKPA